LPRAAAAAPASCAARSTNWRPPSRSPPSWPPKPAPAWLVILEHTVEQGNPADAPQLAPAIARVTRRAGTPPRAVTTDRGYGEARVEAELHDLGVRTVAIPRKAQPRPARRALEHRRSFRDLVKWRTGCEGRIAHLKRRSGWDRTLLDGLTGARTWCGHGVFAHNLNKISALAA
jgi:IS5 family transposase